MLLVLLGMAIPTMIICGCLLQINLPEKQEHFIFFFWACLLSFVMCLVRNPSVTLGMLGCMVCALLVLLDQPSFWESPVGRQVLVIRVFSDVNNTAMAFDSTGNKESEKEAIEIVSKSTYGYVLPPFDGKDDSKTAWHLAQTNHFQKEPGRTTFFDYTKERFAHLEDRQAIKNEAYKFIEEGYPGHKLQQEVKNYQCEMLQPGFSSPFARFWKTLERYSSVVSFHSFGNDLQKVEETLGTTRSVNYLRASHYQGQSLYTEWNPQTQMYGNTMTNKQFMEKSFIPWCKTTVATGHTCYPPKIALVKEDYKRWNDAERNATHGKRAWASVFTGFQIVRTIILDDLDCWNMPAFGVGFFQVNPLLSATSLHYYDEVLQKHLSSPVFSIGFWFYVLVPFVPVVFLVY